MLLGKPFDDPGLDQEKLVRDGNLILGGKWVNGCVSVVDPFYFFNDLVIFMEQFFRNITVFRSHGDELFVVKRNPQLFSKAEADLSAAASEFTADRNDFVHDPIPPFLNPKWFS